MDRTKLDLLRHAFVEVVQEVRQTAADANIPSFAIRIEASGRTVSGDASLTCAIGRETYDLEVKSPDLDAAVDEWLHRIGFERRHQALALPHPGSTVVDQETDGSDIPY